jgi:hypothetical protein
MPQRFQLPDGLVFFDDFDGAGVKGGEWIGGIGRGGSGNVHIGPDRITGRGGGVLHLIFRGKPPRVGSMAEQRFRLDRKVTELWFEFDIYIPDNYQHRSPGNDKFFALWESAYSNQQIDQGELFGVLWPTSSRGPRHAIGKPGDAYLALPGNLRGSSVNRQLATVPNFITDQERGRWNNFRLHYRLSSNAMANDGALDVWWNGVRRVSGSNRALPSVSAGRFIQHGYLLGAASAGYDADTHFRIDNVRIYSRNPNW